MGYRLSNQPIDKSRIVTKYRTPKSKILFFAEGAETEIIYLQEFKRRYDNTTKNIKIEIFSRLKHLTGNSNQLYVVKAAKDYLKNCQDLGKKKRNFINDTISKLEYDNLSLEEFKSLIEELERRIDHTVLNPRDAFKSQLHSIKVAFEFDAELGDKICFILDRDHHSFSPEQFDDVLSICKEENYELGISTPNFEFFLLLHLTDDFSDTRHSDIFNNTSNFAEEKLKVLLKEKTGKGFNKASYDAAYFLNRLECFQENIKKFEVDNLNLKHKIGSSLGLMFTSIID